MKPGGSVREYSGIGAWDRRRSRSGQQIGRAGNTKLLEVALVYPRFHAERGNSNA